MIEALILAKVIMIGAVFRLGRGFEHKPLIYPTLYKTVVFTLFVALSSPSTWSRVSGGGAREVWFVLGNGPHEFLAGSLIIFVAFIPFFAFKEMARVLGEEKIRVLFFRESDAASADAEKSGKAA